MSGPLPYADAMARLTAPGQPFEMEVREIRGVGVRTWKAAPPTLRAVLDRSLGHGDADFLVYEDRRTSFDAHYRQASTLAHRLRDDLGVQQGDRVAIAMRNLPEWAVAFWAIVATGAVVVPLNAWWTGRELADALADSGAVVAVTDSERARRLGPERAVAATLRTVVVVDDEPDDRTPRGSGASLGDCGLDELLGSVAADATPPDVVIDPDDDATIFYTSGTTGRPKGAVGTHRNACTNLMSLFCTRAVDRLRMEPQGTPGTPSARCALLSVPLFHATGCHAVLVASTAAGSKLVLMHHFDPERALELIERERVTVFGGVPTVVLRVLDSPDLPRRDVSSVRSVSYGGAPAPPDLVRRIRAAFATGQPGNGYGLTETSGVTAYNSAEDYAARPDSVGRAVPVADVAIVPVDATAGPDGVAIGPDGTPPAASPGTVGELWVRGPHVVRGYWNRPEETSQAIVHGWLRTGDVARIDDEGFISIVDRAKDVVIRGGENVYSVEVEGALSSHEAVAECAVIGVPHPTLGEEVGAVVVLRPGARVTAADLADHVRRRLAAFCAPTRIWFRSRPLPRNPGGKLMKRQLRADVLGGGDAARGDAGRWDTGGEGNGSEAPELSTGHVPPTPGT